MSDGLALATNLKIEIADAGEVSPATVFDHHEKWILMSPMVLPLAMIALLHFLHLSGGHRYIMLLLVRGFIFLGSTHAMLSIFVTACLPEGRKVIKESFRHKAIWLIFILVLIVGCPVIAMAKQMHYLSYETWLLLLLPAMVFRAPHQVRQTYGFSRAYSQAGADKLSDHERLKIDKLGRQELFFFNIMAGLTIVQYVLALTPLRSMYLFEIIAALTAIPAVAIIVIGLRYTGKVWRNKKIFLTRVAFFTITGLSPLGLFCTCCNHGTEYLSLTLKMIRKSKVTRKRIMYCAVIAAILLSSVVEIGLTIYERVVPRSFAFGSPAIVIQISYYIAFTLNYVHAVLDRYLFRFRDPVVRQNLGPLFG